ncbi:MAG TPA: helix-turn-helix domain-containing protein [Dehalococcoidia bacterium]|nr:helix-turn-helix domain-containing protein [Dehalococcoidia bacterium]
MGDVISEMQGLGYSEYEARAYVTLLERGPLTGYQLARATSIPRPNIYPVLDRLQKRGAVSRVESKGGSRYLALPAEAMLDRLGRELGTRLEKAREALREVHESAGPEVVWNLDGREAVLNRAVSMVDRAERRVLVGVWSAEAAVLAQAIQRAEARGVRVTTLCIEACLEECGGCRGEVYRYPVASGERGRWLVLSVDDRELLAAQLGNEGATGAATQLGVQVAIGSQYLLNAIAAAEIVRSLGPKMIGTLDDRARNALVGAGLAVDGEPWFQSVLSAVRAGRI